MRKNKRKEIEMIFKNFSKTIDEILSLEGMELLEVISRNKRLNKVLVENLVFMFVLHFFMITDNFFTKSNEGIRVSDNKEDMMWLFSRKGQRVASMVLELRKNMKTLEQLINEKREKTQREYLEAVQKTLELEKKLGYLLH